MDLNRPAALWLPGFSHDSGWMGLRLILSAALSRTGRLADCRPRPDFA